MTSPDRKLRQDVSVKVHINLLIALVLLNLHFLPNQAGRMFKNVGKYVRFDILIKNKNPFVLQLFCETVRKLMDSNYNYKFYYFF